MKKFYVINKLDDLSIELAIKMTNYLVDHGLIEDEKNPDLVISIGGDGTMLKAIHFYLDKLDKVAFVGVHTGTLGFYTDFTELEVDQLLEYIVKDEYKTIAFNLLEVKVDHSKGINKYYAINEARIENNKKTQVIDIYIDGSYFETFRGNGLNFSTGTGSTGYNKSIGGPILHPKTNAYIMAEIAPINNVAYRTISSPLVLTDYQVTKTIFKEIEGGILGFDSKTIDLKRRFRHINSIEFYLSEKKVTFVRYRPLAFIDRVQKNFLYSI